MRRISDEEREETLAMIERSLCIRLRYHNGWCAEICVDGSDVEETDSYDDAHAALDEAMTIFNRVKEEELQSWLER